MVLKAVPWAISMKFLRLDFHGEQRQGSVARKNQRLEAMRPAVATMNAFLGCLPLLRLQQVGPALEAAPQG